MRIKFGSDDSIYRIYKKIEDIKSDEKIIIFVHPDNQIFDNIWWGKQLLSLLEDKGLDYMFCAKRKNSLQYYEQTGLNYREKQKSIFKKILDLFLKLRENIKNYHIEGIRYQKHASFFIFTLEILGVFGLLFGVYRVVSHTATIYIQPSYSIQEYVYNFRYYPEGSEYTRIYESSNFLSIPYSTGSVKIKHTDSFGVNNISRLQNPATGKVRFYNSTSEPLSLVANTRLVSDDGLIFRTRNWLSIPAGDSNNPGVQDVEVVASAKDIEESLQGKRGNINKGTKLLVLQLQNRYGEDDLYAESLANFTGGETILDGTVSEQDIDYMNENLEDYLLENKKDILMESDIPDGHIILDSGDMINLEVNSFEHSADPGDEVSEFAGTLNGTIKYLYIDRKALKKNIQKFLEQRDLQTLEVIDIDRNSISFLDYNDGSYDSMIVPTSLDVIFGYNFEDDINDLKNNIKIHVAGKTKPKAREFILDYSEIDLAIVRITPPWHDTLPISSRINIKIDK